LVDQPNYGTHHLNLLDSITFQSNAKTLDKAKIVKLYVEEHKSAEQIAAEVGCSKTMVVTTLKRAKCLRPKKGARVIPSNYRHHVIPYGYRKVDNALMVNPKEVRICRLIVDLIERKKMNVSGVVKFLTTSKIKNREGKAVWYPAMIRRIFARWKGKL
jgi:hypothetical protein